MNTYTDAQVEAKIATLRGLVEQLTERVEANEGAIAQNSSDMDVSYLVICGALVFFMQAGFAMLEAGIVQSKNVTNILFKNMIDASIAAICFWLLGYGFAYGTDKGYGFIGSDNFATEDIHNGTGGWEGWFFQWAFTGACATIVAGSVAERTKLEAYFIYSIVLTTFIYPVVVHWGWGSGWLSAWGAWPNDDGKAHPIFTYSEDSNGMIDFAGSGVVHMVGGFSGLMGAIVVGPRTGKFDPITGQAIELTQGNKTLQSLGVFILWFGWYGFNCGSTLMISGGAANVAGKVAMTTTISAATGCITASILGKVFDGHFDVSIGLNGILAGLVSITANCSVVNPWMALIIGFVGAIILYAGHHILNVLKIDDPCDACVVHGFCGVWGIWATGIFCTDENVQYAAYPNTNDACGRGEQFGVQVVGSLCIIAWTVATAGALFVAIDKTVGMRVSSDMEDLGLDASEHGLTGYPLVELADKPPAHYYNQAPPPPPMPNQYSAPPQETVQQRAAPPPVPAAPAPPSVQAPQPTYPANMVYAPQAPQFAQPPYGGYGMPFGSA